MAAKKLRSFCLTKEGDGRSPSDTISADRCQVTHHLAHVHASDEDQMGDAAKSFQLVLRPEFLRMHTDIWWGTCWLCHDTHRKFFPKNDVCLKAKGIVTAGHFDITAF
jgi:hypothetical protein